ncbi:hypothetical protein ISS09_04680, partial [Candidatus Woesearchaeota archaeon]|nr:hypothetical protein [Candidatus Woesearchaeota archaeon]
MVENLLSKVKSGMKKAVVKTIYTGLLVGTLLASTVMAQDVRVTGNYADQKQRPIPEAQVEY